MFERFTDRARKVMALANQQAQRFNHEYIGTEHILLGLVKEGSGVGANVLKNLGVELKDVRLAVEKLIRSGPDMVTQGKLPQTPLAKKAIEQAISEARGFGHNYVGTEHVMLGLIAVHDGVAGQVLQNAGVRLEAARAEVLNMLGAGESDSPADEEGVDIDAIRFTDRARKVLSVARREAAASSATAVQTGHIMLGLVIEGSGVGANVLKNLGVDIAVDRIREVLNMPEGEGGAADGRSLELSSEAKAVIESAHEESASIFRHRHVGSEHLLLGLVHARDASNGQLSLGFEQAAHQVRDAILDLLGPDSATEGDDKYEKRVRMARMRDSMRAMARREEARADPFDVYRNAREVAAELQHGKPGTEHLLLGIIRHPESSAAKVLASLGVTYDAVYDAVAKGNVTG